MDWAGAIELNRDALRGILASLFAMLGLSEGGTAVVAQIPKLVYRFILRQLKPAESAVRRLIIMAARGLVVELNPSQPAAEAKGSAKQKKAKRKRGSRRASFPLFDKRKPSAALVWLDGEPFIPDDYDSQAHRKARVPVASRTSSPDGPVDARRLCQRLQALKRALEDLPGQAKRLLRLRARRAKVPHLKHVLPLRPGLAPGQRRKPIYEVDQVLTECNGLAWDVLKLDTS